MIHNMNYNLDLQESRCQILTSANAIVSGLGTSVSMGVAIIPLSCLQGFGIGAIAGIISGIVISLFDCEDAYFKIISYIAIESVAIYGVTAAAAALGFVAAPITFPTALIITIDSIIIQNLIVSCIGCVIENQNCFVRYCRDVFRVQQNPIEIFNIAQNHMQHR